MDWDLGPILVGLEISGAYSAGDAKSRGLATGECQMHRGYAFTEEFYQMKRLISARLTRLPDPIDSPCAGSLFVWRMRLDNST
jgi:hypothetical protein